MDYILRNTIAIQGNIASNPVHQNAKSSVRQLRRAPARHQLPSLSFTFCYTVFAVIFSWIAIIKYADDFVVTASDKDTLTDIKEMLKEFLGQRGLILSEEKTKLTSIHEGFDFLGWNFRKYKGKLIIKPSNKSVSKIRKTISKIIKDNKTSTQENLIYQLNQVTRGWAEYHHSVCAKEIFAKIDHTTWEMLWRWAKRRHPNKPKGWIVNKYWKYHKGRNWSFKTDKNILFCMNDMPIVRYPQVKLDANPFLDSEYFINRKKNRDRKRRKAIRSNRAAQIGYYAL